MSSAANCRWRFKVSDGPLEYNLGSRKANNFLTRCHIKMTWGLKSWVLQFKATYFTHNAAVLSLEWGTMTKKTNEFTAKTQILYS